MERRDYERRVGVQFPAQPTPGTVFNPLNKGLQAENRRLRGRNFMRLRT